jgi:SAM-dependent methyltransferase
VAEVSGPTPGGAPDLTRLGAHGSWLKRLVWSLVRRIFKAEIATLSDYERLLAAKLAAIDLARSELRRHLEARIDQLAAELDDLRRALFSSPREGSPPAGAGTGEDAGRVAASEGAVVALQRVVVELQGELEGIRDGGLPALGREITVLQRELEGVRDRRLPTAEEDLARFQGALQSVQALCEELRDERLVSLSNRVDALVERLYDEIAASASVTERLALGEPLHLALDRATEARIPEAVASASAAFIDTFRGARVEILQRVREYLDLLQGSGPILDLGCGRGELLEALSSVGIVARGVDSDPAMVEACRRRGLAVEQREVTEALTAVEPGSLGAITAIHVLEHLPVARWMELVELSARALRGGGLLVCECPNPEALRVGAELFWIDPTHRSPIHPEALAFVVRACGLEVVETRRRRPFPAEQLLASGDQPAEVRRLAERLDAYLSGPRDFAIVARKPA